MPREAVSELKAARYRHYGSPRFCMLLGTCDIGEAVTEDGRHVFTTWGLNLDAEKVDWHKKNTLFEIIDLDGFGELVVKPEMMALIKPSIIDAADAKKRWLEPVARKQDSHVRV